MADRRSIFANVTALAMGQAGAMALGLVTHGILARAVGPADYGILGFAVAVISYFGIAASFGTETWATREIAAHRTAVRNTTGQILALRLTLSIGAFAGLIVLVSVWGQRDLIGTVVLIQGAGLFIAAIGLDYAFQGLERMEAVARRQVLSATVALSGVAAVVSLGGGIVAAAVALQGAAAIAAIVMLWEFTRLAGLPRLRQITFASARRILRESAPLAVTGVFVTLYIYVDIVMLGFLRSEIEVGHYTASVRILMIGLVVAAVFRTAVLPVLARLHAAPAERHEAGVHHARAVTALGGLIAAGGFVLAPDILTVIYGEEFRDGATMLRILMTNLLFANATEVLHTQLVAWRLQSQQMRIMIGAAAANIALNFALIPLYGGEGAALATLICTLLIFVLIARTLMRNGFETHAAAMLRAIALAATIAAFGWAVEIPIEGALLRVLAIGATMSVIYLAAAWALRIVQPSDTIRYFTRI